MDASELKVGSRYMCWMADECGVDGGVECDCSPAGWERVELVGFVPVLKDPIACREAPEATFCAVRRFSLDRTMGPMLLVCASNMSAV